MLINYTKIGFLALKRAWNKESCRYFTSNVKNYQILLYNVVKNSSIILFKMDTAYFFWKGVIMENKIIKVIYFDCLLIDIDIYVFKKHRLNGAAFYL